MATVYWEPKAVAVALVGTIQVTGFDAATTYTVTIGGVAISVPGNTDVNTTASDLQAALAASTHPYFAAITWTVSTDTVTGTAGTAGTDHFPVSSVTGGTGTIGAWTVSTAVTGPNFWSEAENWSGGAVPVSTDDVIFRDSAIPVCWGLAQDTVALTSLRIDQSYTGRIGLRIDTFATSADSVTSDATVPEYRQIYLDIEYDDLDIGQHLGPGAPTGSPRLYIDNDKAGASETRVHNSSASGDGSKPAILLLYTNSGADVEIRNAPGGVGIAKGLPDETATLGDITITDTTASSRVYVGDGATYTNYTQRGGVNRIESAATITLVEVRGGELDIDGQDYLITTLTMRGGICRDRHDNSGGNEWTTINQEAGSLDLSLTNLPRVCATLNLEGGDVTAKWSATDGITPTTANEPTATTVRKITIAAA